MEKPWFGRKCFGWGWGLPQRWQGWVVLILYLLFMRALFTIVLPQELLIVFGILITFIFFITIWVTSGKPQWGSWCCTKKK